MMLDGKSGKIRQGTRSKKKSLIDMAGIKCQVTLYSMAVTNGTGQGGKTLQDRELAASVRNLALAEIEKILKKPEHKLYGAVIVKLAGTVLPRLNEHTGEDGGAIEVTLVKYAQNPITV